MFHRIFIGTIAWLAATSAAFADVGTTAATPATISDSALRPPAIAAQFLADRCWDCHQGDDAESGLDLTSLSQESLTVSEDSDPDRFDTWVRIVDRVRSGEMPPPDPHSFATEPTDEPSQQFLQATEAWLHDHQAAEFAQSGRVQGKRLTNLQLERSLHDLLAIDIPLGEVFSEEPRTAGFYSVAAGQTMSHYQLEQQLRAVDLALEEAFRRATAADDDPYEKTFQPDAIARRRPGQRNREPELLDGAAVVWAGRVIFYGRMAVTTAPADGWYRFTLTASSLKQPQDRGVWCSVRSGLCVSAAPLLQTWGGFEATEQPNSWTFDVWLPKGHMLEVRPADATLKFARFNGGQVGAGEGETQDVPGVAFHQVTMQRIHRGPDNEALRRQLLGDRADELIAADTIESEAAKSNPLRRELRQRIRLFAQRAFRRPLDDRDIRPYLAIANTALSDGQSPLVALRAAYRAILVSPRFLYLPEPLGRLDDYAVATRLSYFLWNRPPDESLLAAAAAGTLHDPASLVSQVRRMLHEPAGRQFAADFAHQWLDLCEIDATEPDPKLFRDYDPIVQYSMVQETEQFLQTILDENRSVTDLIAADFTILNSRLARFYEIDVAIDDRMQPVRLQPSDRRGGLLTQGAILKITANGTTTSPVLRGVWVSERLLGTPIPPPPTNVPAIEPDIRGAVSIRQQLALHTADGSCASCHVKMDPPGFALENYDPSGKWRDQYPAVRGVKRLPVDASATTARGETFVDIAGLKQILANDPQQLARNLVEHFIACGTGATVQFADRPAVDQIVASTAADHYGVASLLEATLTSPLFLNK